MTIYPPVILQRYWTSSRYNLTDMTKFRRIVLIHIFLQIFNYFLFISVINFTWLLDTTMRFVLFLWMLEKFQKLRVSERGISLHSVGKVPCHVSIYIRYLFLFQLDFGYRLSEKDLFIVFMIVITRIAILLIHVRFGKVEDRLSQAG